MTDKMKAAGELSLGELQVEEEKEPSMKNKVWLFLGGREKGTKRRGEIQQPGDCMLSSVPSRNISVRVHCSKRCFLSGCHIQTFVTESFQSAMNFRFSSGLWEKNKKQKKRIRFYQSSLYNKLRFLFHQARGDLFRYHLILFGFGCWEITLE